MTNFTFDRRRVAAAGRPVPDRHPRPQRHRRAAVGHRCAGDVAVWPGSLHQIDGTSIPTALSGTLGDLVDLTPMRMVACPSTRGGVDLTAGTHTFAAANFFRSFEVTSVSMQGAAPVTL